MEMWFNNSFLTYLIIYMLEFKIIKMQNAPMINPWMLGNFLKIDHIVVCFLKIWNSAWFLLEIVDQVANRLDLRPAAELLDSWPGSNLFALA